MVNMIRGIKTRIDEQIQIQKDAINKMTKIRNQILDLDPSIDVRAEMHEELDNLAIMHNTAKTALIQLNRELDNERYLLTLPPEDRPIPVGRQNASERDNARIIDTISTNDEARGLRRSSKKRRKSRKRKSRKSRKSRKRKSRKNKKK